MKGSGWLVRDPSPTVPYGMPGSHEEFNPVHHGFERYHAFVAIRICTVSRKQP